MAIKISGAKLPILGLDTSQPAEYINAQNSPDCKNVDIIKDVIQSREGTNLMGDIIASGSDTSILGGLEFETSGLFYNVRVGTEIAERWNSSSETWDSITDVVLSGTSSSSVSLATPLINGSEILTFTNGVNAIQKWTGTGYHTNLGGNPPKTKYIENFGPYLVCANIVNDGFGNTYNKRVAWSDTGNPEEWDTATTNAGYQDLIDGGDITGLKRYGNYLTVHKKDVIYLGYQTGTTAVFKFDPQYTFGSIANNTIQMLPNGLMAYLSVDGIRAFNGSTSTWIDSVVNEDIKNTINIEYAYKSFAMINQKLNEYWIAIPTGADTHPSTIYRFNYETGAMLKNETPYTLRCGWSFSDSENVTWDDLQGTWDDQTLSWNEYSSANLIPVPTLSDESGYTYKLTGITNNDNDIAIENVWTSKDYTAELDGQMSRWKMMEIWAKGNNLTLEYSIDRGESWIEVGTYSLNSSYPTDDSPIVAYFDVVSTKIRFRFKNITTGETFTLKQFIIYHTPREMRLN